MQQIVLDENVSLQLVDRLAACGYEVLAVAHQPTRGLSDESVFALATARSAVLVTRDTHFTNPLRFPPSQTGGIVYVTSGNLRGSEEAGLVEQFFRTHEPELFRGRLVLLSHGGVRIR